jgi:putative tricarboxylic transport membrane protein
MLGSYALRNNVFDVGITLVLGFLGYLMSRGGFPTAPTVLGLVLGGMLESEMRTALNFSRGSWSVFFTRPVPLVLILISIMTVVSQVVKANRPKKPVIIGGMEVPDEDDEE